MIRKLPQELLVKIFSFLPIEDLALNVQHVCKLWCQVAQDNSIWKDKAYQPYHYTPVPSIIKVLEQSPKLEVFNFLNLYINDMASHDTIEKVYRHLMCHSMCIKKLVLFVDCFNHYCVRNLLIARCKSIESLDIKFQIYKVSDAMKYITQVMRCVGECSKLLELKLSGPFACERSALLAVAEGCVLLRSLDINKCECLHIAILQHLLDRENDTLVSLKVPWASQDGQSTLPVIAAHCRKLELLSISRPANKNIVEAPCKDVLKDMPKLKYLSLLFIPCSAPNTYSLFVTASLENLVNLNLCYSSQVSDVILNIIFNKCLKLKRLDLRSCCNVTSEGFRSIHMLQLLEYLDLEQCTNICDEAIAYIVKCKTLRFLNLRYISGLSNKAVCLCCDNLKLLRFGYGWINFEQPRVKDIESRRYFHRLHQNNCV